MQKTTALVTGATSGIGLELAKILAENGHDLVLVARRADILKKVAAELAGAHGVKVHVIRKDLSKPESPEEIAKELSKKKIQIGILVNNAGFGDNAAFANSDWKIASGMILTNIHALAHLTRLFLPGMLSRKTGKVLNVGSTAGLQAGPMMAVYYASKAFVNHFSEAVDAEVSGSGVSVTVLCPGPTETGFQTASNAHGMKLFSYLSVASARSVAESGYNGMMSGRRMVIHGLLNKILAFNLRLSPRRLATAIAGMVNGK